MLFQVYCQKCNKDLSSSGGDVFPSGRIYCSWSQGRPQWGCQDYEPSILIKEGKPPRERDVQAVYVSPNKILLNIILLNIKKFSKLEEKI